MSGPICAATLTIAVLVLVLVLARGRLTLISVVGHSMMPAYRDGDRLLVLRRPPRKHGEVIVFDTQAVGRPNGSVEWLMKRVTALPGDPVPTEVSPAVGGDSVVPAGAVTVRGDNPQSVDSRHFGYVPAEMVLGVVIGRLARSGERRGRSAGSVGG